MKKKFLVLGSNSFSASNFINYLLSKNCRVIGISRSNEIKRCYLPYKNSKNIKLFKFYKLDLNKDINKIISLTKKYKPNYIVNYIAQGMVAESWNNPEDWYLTNIVGQAKMYKELSKFNFIKKFIHVTTPEVYGNTKKKIDESFKFNPSTPYAISRATIDLHLKKYYENFNLPIIFTRTANIYGPGQQLYRIVPKALIYARLKKKIDLHGGGKSKRSFIYINDASDATFKICVKGKLGQTYHISNNQIISIKNVLKKISLISNVKLENLIKITKDRIGKDGNYHLNNKKLRNNIKWKPKTSLKKGLIETLKWIDENLKVLKKEKFNYIHKK